MTLAELFHSIMKCVDVDIDECETENGGCSSVAICSNIVGSFTCECKTGYSGDGFTCDGKSIKIKISSINRRSLHIWSCDTDAATSRDMRYVSI